MRNKLFKIGYRVNAVQSVFWGMKTVGFTFLFTAFSVLLLTVYVNVPAIPAIVIWLVLAITISFFIIKERIKAVKRSFNVKEKGAENKYKQEPIGDEKVLGTVFAVKKTIGKTFSFLGSGRRGSGRNLHPENTIMFTDKRILIVQVPISGGSAAMRDMPLGTIDAVQMTMLLNKSGVRGKGEELLAEGLSEFLSTVQIIEDIAVNEVESIKIGRFTIKIVTKEGKSYRYTMGGPKSKAEAQSALQEFKY